MAFVLSSLDSVDHFETLTTPDSRRQRVISAVGMGLTRAAFLLDVRELASRRHFTIATYEASTPKRGEPKEQDQATHSNLRRFVVVQVLYPSSRATATINGLESLAGGVLFFGGTQPLARNALGVPSPWGLVRGSPYAEK